MTAKQNQMHAVRLATPSVVSFVKDRKYINPAGAGAVARMAAGPREVHHSGADCKCSQHFAGGRRRGVSKQWAELNK
jgi:hypothetical protein